MGQHAIDINADVGESFGRWVLGNDATLMPHVTSANIACGFHAGDPHIMRECVKLAKQHGVGVGAHVGFADLAGFGRRRIDMTPSQFKDHVVYQLGAMMGFAAAEGVRVEHVKPHSGMYKLCMENAEFADALAASIYEVDPTIILVLGGKIARAAAQNAGLPYIEEGLVDLEYDENGAYVPEWPKKSWPPERVAERAVQLAKEKTITYRNGQKVSVAARSMCIHGDAENATQIAEKVRKALAATGVAAVPLRKILAMES